MAIVNVSVQVGQLNTPIELQRYEYKIDEGKYENYQLDEQAKNMTNTELLEYQQRKIKDQDQEIEEITGEVKKGKEMGKVIKTNLESQNKLLDDVEWITLIVKCQELKRNLITMWLIHQAAA